MKKLLLLCVLTAYLGLHDAVAQWSVNGSNIYNTNTGNVGIGNNSPTTLLYVGKNMTEPSITVRNLGGSGGATYTMIDDASGANWKFKAINTGGFKIRDNANGLDVVTIEPNSFANAIYIKGTDNIGIGTANPDPSAALDVTSATMGFLPPRMTREQLQAIPAPAEGLIVYCTDCASDAEGRLALFMEGSWHSLKVIKCIDVNSPTEGTSVPSFYDITWNWEPVPGATGYRWNTVNDISTAENLGTSLTRPEELLTPGTSYTRYVWAYNDCSLSAATAITVSTLSWVCGDPYTVEHVAGEFAPVSKTVTYGTVTNIPGEPAKCWISQNLGADHQADSVDDPTEASAGWYWSYNRSRGYKHDGTTLTPTWVYFVDCVYITWQPENDPCINEIGHGWRLPTKTEFENISQAGAWTDWNGPWNSPLKMHAAGWLYISDGNLQYRGNSGFYWTSTPWWSTLPWLGTLLNFGETYSSISALDMRNGMSVRCVKD